MNTETLNPYAIPRPISFKSVLRWSPKERKLRLFRVTWERIKGGNPIGTPGGSYSAQFSTALAFKPREITAGIAWERELFRFRLWIKMPCVALSLHWQRTYGGHFA